MRRGYIHKAVIPNLFFFFFVAQIFSPYIYGVTIYLEVLIALLDLNFRRWAFTGQYKVILSVIVILPLLFLRPAISIKLFCLIISVAYLNYSYCNGFFLLKKYFLLSIWVAIIQFCLFYTIPELSIIFGPQNVSFLIWGEYATPTNSNFYEAVSGIIRVCGLSREAGFFASLLNCVILYHYLEKKNTGQRLSLKYKILLLVAYVISFSKMSLLLLPVVLVFAFRRQINRIHVCIVLILFYVIQIVFWYHSNFLLVDGNDTFTHRFGAYGIMLDIHNFLDLFLGVKDLTYQQFDGMYAKQYFDIIDGLGNFGGMGGYVLYNGIVLTSILYFYLFNLGITSSGILMLLLLTMNVQLDTNQNFVVLAYFIALRYLKVSRKEAALRWITAAAS